MTTSLTTVGEIAAAVSTMLGYQPDNQIVGLIATPDGRLVLVFGVQPDATDDQVTQSFVAALTAASQVVSDGHLHLMALCYGDTTCPDVPDLPITGIFRVVDGRVYCEYPGCDAGCPSSGWVIPDISVMDLDRAVAGDPISRPLSRADLVASLSCPREDWTEEQSAALDDLWETGNVVEDGPAGAAVLATLCSDATVRDYWYSQIVDAAEGGNLDALCDTLATYAAEVPDRYAGAIIPIAAIAHICANQATRANVLLNRIGDTYTARALEENSAFEMASLLLHIPPPLATEMLTLALRGL